MSKQSEAKERQGYVSRHIPLTCCNCEFFASDIEEIQVRSMFGDDGYTKESNMRCSIGGFAVKKMGTCDEFCLKK